MEINGFVAQVGAWLINCFGVTTAYNTNERSHRFLEEALELVQSLDCTKEEALALVEYVYGRKKGKPEQELGGTMVTLAALCFANKFNLFDAMHREYFRITTPRTMAKIRKKQSGKPKDSALPQ